MTMAKSVTFAVLIFAAVFVEKGTGLKCFQCTSKLNEDCRDPEKSGIKSSTCSRALKATTINRISEAIGNNEWLEDDPDNDNEKCIKIVINYKTQKLKNPKNPTTTSATDVSIEKTGTTAQDYVIRGCKSEDENPNQICEKIHNKAESNLEVKYCNTCLDDECNGSTRISSLTILLSNLLIIFPLYLFIN